MGRDGHVVFKESPPIGEEARAFLLFFLLSSAVWISLCLRESFLNACSMVKERNEEGKEGEE